MRKLFKKIIVSLRKNFFKNIKISDDAQITSEGIVIIDRKKSDLELKKEQEVLRTIYQSGFCRDKEK